MFSLKFSVVAIFAVFVITMLGVRMYHSKDAERRGPSAATYILLAGVIAALFVGAAVVVLRMNRGVDKFDFADYYAPRVYKMKL